jgi:hypothetical protein
MILAVLEVLDSNRYDGGSYFDEIWTIRKLVNGHRMELTVVSTKNGDSENTFVPVGWKCKTARTSTMTGD